jgi:hypothetical protein
MSVHPSLRLSVFLLPVRTKELLLLPLEGFSWNLIFHHFSNINRENSRFIEIWQEYWVLYLKNNILGTLFEEKYIGYFTWRTMYLVLYLKNNILGTLIEEKYIGYFTWRTMYWVLYLKNNILGTLFEEQCIGYFNWRKVYWVLYLKNNILGNLLEEQ